MRGKCCRGFLPFFPFFPYGCLLFSLLCFPANFPCYPLHILDGPSVWELLCDAGTCSIWVTLERSTLSHNCRIYGSHLCLNTFQVLVLSTLNTFSLCNGVKMKTPFGLVHLSGGSSCIPVGKREGRRLNELKTKLWRRKKLFSVVQSLIQSAVPLAHVLLIF